MIDTEIKIKIPEGWKQEKLGQYVDVQGGFAFKSNDYQDNGVPLIRIGNVGKGQVSHKDFIYLSEKLYKNSQNFQLKEGDVLMGMTGDLGKICVVKKDDLPALLNQRVGRFNKKENTDLKLIFYIISYERTQNNLSYYFAGGAQANISPSQIESIKVLFPENQKEQQKIAEVLTTIDEAIEKTDAIIEKNKRIQQGLMQDLFRYGIDEHGNIRSEKTHKFKTVRIGNEEIKIPEEWGWDAIVNNLEIVDYRGKSPTKVDDGIFLVTARNIKNGIIDYSLSQEFVPASEYSKIMSRGKAKLGDVLFTTEAPMGEVANIDNENIALAQRIIKFDGTRKNINNYYLKYLLTSEPLRKQLFSDSTGSTVTGIKGSRLKKIFILIPKREEQDKINNLLQSQDFKMKKEQTYKQKLLSLKRGLMEDLLTGKVRVNSLIN